MSPLDIMEIKFHKTLKDVLSYLIKTFGDIMMFIVYSVDTKLKYPEK